MQIKAVYPTMFGELIEQPIPLPPSLVREGGEIKKRRFAPLRHPNYWGGIAKNKNWRRGKLNTVGGG
jgi:hypothetical protein